MPAIATLVNVALKSTVVLGVAWIHTLVLRKRSAASRHLVWTAAAAALIALPLMATVLPALHIPTPGSGDPGVVFRALGIASATAAPVDATPAGSAIPLGTASGSRPL